MSQRLIKKTLSDLTTRSGLAVAALRGSEPDDGTGDGNGNGDNGSSGSGDGGGSGDGNGDGGNNSDDGASTDGKDDPEKEALRKRMVAADRRASDLEKRLKEFEDKDKTESQRLTDEVTNLKAQNEELQKALREAKVQNAFLTSNDYQWQDPDTALRLADLSEVVDEDGEVDKKALKRALKDLADGKPFLVKTQEANGSNGSGQSGAGVGSGKKGGKQEFDENELLRRYSSLAQRS